MVSLSFDKFSSVVPVVNGDAPPTYGSLYRGTAYQGGSFLTFIYGPILPRAVDNRVNPLVVIERATATYNP